ncbi:nitronate monooxygenase [Tsukamurella sp. 8F]|uniref:nitronate monooxygenase n=1 Tax=unclassified Tsukamurella TaxID=2633480 RepID=UPI0023B9E14A|nr:MULTISPECIES: nitronate monooxygenase [unclassified Tsukamurella]MDF0529730.1 nitronate monooxygenase [Tsukamurella sp. 8J]MDF0586015.1 nitronate monooxygenase [Tsukamurella sp. 8F]
MDLLDLLKIDVPVLQAGMGDLAPAGLAAAVASAGALGTIGFRAPAELRKQVRQVREIAPDRAVAVNLLMPFTRRAHVDAVLAERPDVMVLAFGGDPGLVQRLHDADVTVCVLVGDVERARQAMSWGTDVLIAQGVESGGHLSGGVVGDDVVRQVLEATATQVTTLFGLGWPCPHRVVANAATRKWCAPDGRAKPLPRIINARSALLSRIAPDGDTGGLVARQRVGLPMFSPAAPTEEMRNDWVERSALYAGETAQRINAVVRAADAVADLTP